VREPGGEVKRATEKRQRVEGTGNGEGETTDMRHYRTASDIRAGVIGYGGAFNMGKAHLSYMREAGMTPAAVCEIDKERLAAARKEWPGLSTYGSAAEMLRESDVDLVAVLTPHNSHAALAVQCAKAGRHVVVEKPMAVTTAECDAMIAAARRNGVALTAFHNRHWDGHILAAVRRVRSGEIGKVVRVDVQMGGWRKPGDWWRSSRSVSGGILYDWGAHLLEYTFQIVDSEIVEVTGFSWSGVWAGQTRWGRDTNEDDAFLAVRYASGAWSTLSISNIESSPNPNLMRVTGTKGAYLMDFREGVTITHPGDATRIEKRANPPSECERFYRNIADHLTAGTPLAITPEWARRPIHVLDLACRSARKGKALRARYR
jgi:predicted dehydrogenase